MELDPLLNRWPVISCADNPDLIYQALEGLHRFRHFGYQDRENVEEALDIMRRHFDLNTRGESITVNPNLKALPLQVTVDDLELAIVGIGCTLLARGAITASDVIPKLNNLLSGIDLMRAQQAA